MNNLVLGEKIDILSKMSFQKKIFKKSHFSCSDVQKSDNV